MIYTLSLGEENLHHNKTSCPPWGSSCAELYTANNIGMSPVKQMGKNSWGGISQHPVWGAQICPGIWKSYPAVMLQQRGAI